MSKKLILDNGDVFDIRPLSYINMTPGAGYISSDMLIEYGEFIMDELDTNLEYKPSLPFDCPLFEELASTFIIIRHELDSTSYFYRNSEYDLFESALIILTTSLTKISKTVDDSYIVDQLHSAVNTIIKWSRTEYVKLAYISANNKISRDIYNVLCNLGAEIKSAGEEGCAGQFV
jgi:hypothetical protein